MKLSFLLQQVDVREPPRLTFLNPLTATEFSLHMSARHQSGLRFFSFLGSIVSWWHLNAMHERDNPDCILPSKLSSFGQWLFNNYFCERTTACGVGCDEGDWDEHDERTIVVG